MNPFKAPGNFLGQNINNNNSLFGNNNQSSLFGNPNPLNSKSGGLFNNNEDKKEGNGTSGSLFGNFGQPSLFGNLNKDNNIFANNNPANSMLFGSATNNVKNNPFSNNNKKEDNDNKKEKKPEGIFNNSNNFVSPEIKDKPFSLFGNDEDNNKKINNEKKIGLFGFNNNSNNSNNDFGKIFINNKEGETPFTGEKEEKENNNNMSSYNPFKNNDNKEKEKEKNQIKFGENNLFNPSVNINNNESIKDSLNLFKNNEVINSQNMFELNNNKSEEVNEENEEMEIDEDLKQDLSSNNDDIINNLWISDNKEIIDDEIDINKKIDYKKLEEKSKNQENKINNINLLILPELSEYYFEKSKSISDYQTFSDSNIRDKFSVEISRKIIEILTKIIKEKNLEEEKESELINITTIYIYFDAFILHRNDAIYLMKLRDELLYKYYISNETLINFEKKSNMIYVKENNNINSIITSLKKIYFQLTMLDINKAYQQIGLLNQEYENIYRRNIFGDKTMKFKEIFMNVEKIIKIYNNIYSLKENFNSKQIISSFNMLSVFKEVVEIINEMQIEKDNMNENMKKIFIECQKIIGLLTGNPDFLINDYNKNNIHLLIMANIFYRFYQNNFIKGIGDCLKNKKTEIDLEKDLINKNLMSIILNCDQNQIEIVQKLKGDYPFLLRYHMIEILSQNAFLFQVENQERYLKEEAFLLFRTFKELKIPFKYYLNYLSFYPNYEIFTVEDVYDIEHLDDEPSDEIKEKGYREALDYALIYINSKFNNCDNIEEIKNEIDEIKNEIGNKIIDTYSNDILYKINKLCLIKYNERNIFKYSILSYIENYNLENKDLKKLQIRQQRTQLCADNELNFEYPKQLDEVIINFYLKTKYVFNQNSFRDIYENNKLRIDKDYKDVQELLNILLNKKDQLSIDSDVRFIINYTQFLLDVMRYNFDKIENNNKYNINIVLTCKKFFVDCFPLPKCPTFIWYHTIMVIKNVIDENIEEFNNDNFIGEYDELSEDLSIWEKKLIYEIMKVEKIIGNIINFEKAKMMYENSISFINDITQGFYFNQNIF